MLSLTQGEHSQQAVDAIEAGRLDVLLPVPATRLTRSPPTTRPSSTASRSARHSAPQWTRGSSFDHVRRRHL